VAIKMDIGPEFNWCIGEAKILELEIFADNDFFRTEAFLQGAYTQAQLNALAMQDVSGYSMEFVMRKLVTGVDPYLRLGEVVIGPKTTTAPAAVSVAGSFNASRVSNTQRVRVAFTKDDTIDGDGRILVPGGTYAGSVERTDAGLESVLWLGQISLLLHAAR
jgi:hypothetical protein